MTRAVYPGSFNPPTVGHMTIIQAAVATHDLASLDIAVSRAALAKGAVERPTLDQRMEVIEASVAHLPTVSVILTELQLIADIAEGYDLVVMGADKWAQVNDPVFYESELHRDQCLARLPRLAIASRGQIHVPEAARLAVPEHIGEVSSTEARQGRDAWMTREARDSGYWNTP